MFMTLYNKDGSVFKLSGPNPVMKDQEIWGDFLTHNLQWKPEISEDKTVMKSHESDFYVKESFLDALEAAKEAAKEAVKEDIKVTESSQTIVKEELRTPVVRHDSENDVVKEEIEKTFIHCLPAIIRERKDALYGEFYKTIQYGSPFSFEAVVVSHTDFTYEIWTDTDKVGKGSILYPKTGYKRWWRVQEKNQKGSGWLLTSIPSDYQPSFE